MEHLKRNSGKVEWYTPDSILESVREVLPRIDLDPASCQLANERVQAKRYYSIDDDGLLQDWGEHAGTVFLNPPYARRVIDKWIEKLVSESRRRNIGQWICLTNNATDTKWGQHLLSEASAVCFLRGRVRFWTPDADRKKDAPLQGQMLCYGGPPDALNCSQFRRSFRHAGQVFETGG